MPHDNIKRDVIKGLKARTECALKGLRLCRRVTRATAVRIGADARNASHRPVRDEPKQLSASSYENKYENEFEKHLLATWLGPRRVLSSDRLGPDFSQSALFALGTNP